MMRSSLNSTNLLNAWEEGVSSHPVRRALLLLRMAWPARSEEDWARAPIGERDGSLLSLREELFGTSLDSVADCPKCGKQIELSFNANDIRLATPTLQHGDDESGLLVEAAGYKVRFRLPNSADLLKAPDREALLNRCISAVFHQGEIVDSMTLPNDVIGPLIEQMQKSDPQADLQIALTCPYCSNAWSIPVDILSYLWSELEDWARRLFLEVHTLASAYGWKESDIVAMSPQRRRFYLDMVGA